MALYRKNPICNDCRIPLVNHYALRCSSCAVLGSNNGMYKKGYLISGEKHPNYIDGRSLINKKCIDCGKDINYQYDRCHSCAAKYFQNRPTFKEKLISRSIGEGNPMFGKKHSLETRKKMSLKAGGIGIPYFNYQYGSGWTEVLKDKIRERDNYKCKICNLTNEEHLIIYNFNLCVHHIDYDKCNNIESNLISLCSQCHARTNYNRKYWKDFLCAILFQNQS